MQIQKAEKMIIEKTSKEFIIRLPISSEMRYIQDIIDYLYYKELTSDYQTEQSEVDVLSRQINKNWWTENKNKFIDK